MENTLKSSHIAMGHSGLLNAVVAFFPYFSSRDLMRVASADEFYSSMSQWMEEIAEGMSSPRVETVEFIRLMYDIAPLPWPRLGDLRRHYAAATEFIGSQQEEAISPPPPLHYNDGYDEEARKAKTRWWHKRPRQTVDESAKSLSKSRLP